MYVMLVAHLAATVATRRRRGRRCAVQPGRRAQRHIDAPGL